MILTLPPSINHLHKHSILRKRSPEPKKTPVAGPAPHDDHEACSRTAGVCLKGHRDPRRFPSDARTRFRARARPGSTP